MTEPATLELLSQLRALQVMLRLDGDTLRVSAPAGALTPALRAALGKRKDEIVDFFRAAEGTVGSPLTPVDRTQPLPLSFAQQRLWFLDQLVPGSTQYMVAEAWRLRGPLDHAALAQALDALVQRHESLRTTFVQRDGVVVQHVAPPTPAAPWSATGQDERHLAIPWSATGQDERHLAIPWSATGQDERHLAIPWSAAGQDESHPAIFESVDLRGLDADTREATALGLIAAAVQRSFALDSGPLFRAALYQLAEEEHVLLVAQHHIITDGWSQDILWHELAALYGAAVEGRSVALPPLPIQYADFAAWQERTLAGTARERLLEYWSARLAGAPPLLGLPTDRPRPSTLSYRGARYRFTLPADLAAALHRLSRQAGCTLFMTLLAAFDVLLFRYSGQSDLCVGTPVAGRTRPELEGVVGFFVNTLVLRTDLSGNPSFRDLLRRVREATLADYEQQALPFDMLVEVLNPERSQGYHPLFQVMFVLQNLAGVSRALPGTTSAPVDIAQDTARFDLTLMLQEDANGIAGEYEYATDLFDHETVVRMAGHYATLLEAVATGADQPIETLPLLTAAERRQLLLEWNRTTVPYPSDRCVHELFEEQAERTPNAVAVVFGERRLTYRELNERANRLARYLQTLGVKPETLVGICMERSLELVVGLLGILKAGGAYLPLDPQYPRARLAFMLGDARVSLLLTQAHLLATLPDQEVRAIYLDRDWEAISRESATNPRCAATAESLIYVMYTSGSTGIPKGIAITHRNVVRLVKGTSFVPLTEDAVFLQLGPVAFDASNLELWGPLLNGARLIVFPPSTPSLRELGQEIERHGVTTLWLTSGLFNEMVEGNLAGLKPLRYVLTGGDVVSPAHVRKAMRALPGCQIVNGYGPTEITTFASCYPVPAPLDESVASLPIGRPIANVRLYILDQHLQPVPIGVPGELVIGGDGVGRGYLHRPELTAERFISDPFSDDPQARLYRSGDLVRYRADGNIEFIGRLDQQVKLRGFRIELGEIEAALRRQPQVGDVAVDVRGDAADDKRLVAYLVAARRPSPSSAELRAFLKTHLPEYMIPSAFVWLDALPLTPQGKLDRRALPTPTMQPSTEGYLAPRTTLHHQLAQIWEELLDARPIGIRDDFFALGGHSLLAARLVDRIERVCGKRIPLATLFAHTTIEGLAEVMLREQEQAPASRLVEIQRGGDRQAFYFLHGDWLGGGFYCRSLARALGEDQPFYVLQPHGLQGSHIPASIEIMARELVAALRDFQPHGPYLLGGYCNGGLIAYEMAQQLRAQGEEVRWLAMIDTTAASPRNRHLGKAISRLGRMTRLDLERQLRLFLRVRHVWDGFLKPWLRLRPAAEFTPAQQRSARSIAQLSQALTRHRGRLRAARSVASALFPPARALREESWAVYRWVMARYVPARYAGHVMVVATEGVVAEVGDPMLGWRSLAGASVGDVLSCSHIECVTTHVDLLAASLRAAIDHVQPSIGQRSSPEEPALPLKRRQWSKIS